MDQIGDMKYNDLLKHAKDLGITFTSSKVIKFFGKLAVKFLFIFCLNFCSLRKSKYSN